MTSRYVYVNVTFPCMSEFDASPADNQPQEKGERKMTDTTMTIREMCETYDVTPRTLRFYEAKELLFPIRKGTHRLFTKQCRARLKLILRGKRFGFSLEEIRQLLDLYDMGDRQATQLERTYQLAAVHLAEMEAQRAELDEAIAELKAEMVWGAAELDRLTQKTPAAA
jgi:DNA-binding transcriptional MerR regulator